MTLGRRSFLLPVPALLLAPPSSPITALAFSPDGRHLVAAQGRKLRVRSVGGGPNREIPIALAQTHDVAFRPDGGLLALGGGTPGESGSVVLLTWPEGRMTGRLTGHRDQVMALAWLPGGSRLISAGADRRVLLHSVPGSGPPSEWKGHTGAVLAAVVAPDGRSVVTAGADRSLRVWNSDTGREVRSLNFHTAAVQCLAFRPPVVGRATAPYCASGGEDRTARVWQPEIGRMVRILRGFQGVVLATRFSRDGSRLFVADAGGMIRCFDADSDELLHEWQAHSGWVYGLDLAPDGKILASGDSTGQVRLWEPESGRPKEL